MNIRTVFLTFVILGMGVSLIAMEKEIPISKSKNSSRSITLKKPKNGKIAELGKLLGPSIALGYATAKAEKENPRPRIVPGTPPPPPLMSGHQQGASRVYDPAALDSLRAEFRKIANLENKLGQFMHELEEFKRQGQVREDLQRIIVQLEELKAQAQEKVKSEAATSSGNPAPQQPTVASWSTGTVMASAAALGLGAASFGLYKFYTPFQNMCTSAWTYTKETAYKLKQRKDIGTLISGAVLTAGLFGYCLFDSVKNNSTK